MRKQSKYKKEDIPGDARWKTFGLSRSQVVRNFKEEERQKEREENKEEKKEENKFSKTEVERLELPNQELKIG